MKKTTPLLAAACALFGATPAALAQQWPTTDPSFTTPPTVGLAERERFGEPGQIVLRGDFDLTAAYTTIKHTADRGQGIPESTAVTTIKVAPAFDVFVARNLSLGGVFGFSFDQGWLDAGAIKGKGRDIRISVGPELGYSFPVPPKGSIYPRIGVGFAHRWLTTDNPIGGSQTTTGYVIQVSAQLPLVFHVAPHFFVGVGPFFRTDVKSISGDKDFDKALSFGLAVDIGAWF